MRANGDSPHIRLLGCETPEQVYVKLREWTELTEREQLTRSVILDVQASVERVMKQVLVHLLEASVFHGDDEEAYHASLNSLHKAVSGLNFATVFRLLKPSLAAFPSPDLANIQPINELRNDVVHDLDVSQIQYKERNPFVDVDCLAQVYVEGWAIRGGLKDLYEAMITEPRALAEANARFVQEHHRPSAGDSQ